jgi:hypothetical protein
VDGLDKCFKLETEKRLTLDFVALVEGESESFGV